MKTLKIATTITELKRAAAKDTYNFLVWAYSNGLEIRQCNYSNGGHGQYIDYWIPGDIGINLYGRTNYQACDIYCIELPIEYFIIGNIERVDIHPENTTEARIDSHDMTVNTMITVGKNILNFDDLLVPGRLSKPNITGRRLFAPFGYSTSPRDSYLGEYGPVLSPSHHAVIDRK